VTDFVLVHGGSHAAWCWDRLVPLLVADERVDAVVAVDLSGHGSKAKLKPLDQISRSDYVADVVTAIEAADLQEVVLVGHSLAGITIPLAAARIPDRIRRVVYLSTSNPLPGQSLNQLMEHPLSPFSRGADFQEMFCNDLDAETRKWLLSKLEDEPLGPLNEPMPAIRLPESISSTYILLAQDQALVPDFQREQAVNAGADEIVTLDAGHCVFASKPAELARILLTYT
jgi:pimeloyl-ACP methyl ester carboxylesterase